MLLHTLREERRSCISICEHHLRLPFRAYFILPGSGGLTSDQVAKFKVEQVQVKDPQTAMKTYVLKDTTSGSDKHKVFCGLCGCTLWTIPMRHGGTHYMIRTPLIENG